MKQKTDDEIETDLTAAHGDSAPSLSNMKCWTADFKRGCTRFFGEDCPGRPNWVMTSEIYGIMISDRKVEMLDIAGTSAEYVYNTFK